MFRARSAPPRTVGVKAWKAGTDIGIPGASFFVSHELYTHTTIANSDGIGWFLDVPPEVRYFNSECSAEGYEPVNQRVEVPPGEVWLPPYMLTAKSGSGGGGGGAGRRWSKAQLCALQGDLMLWCPEAALNFTLGNQDPQTGIRCQAEGGGQTAHGLKAGWHWTVTIWRYPKHWRKQLYAAAHRLGWTHWALQVAQEEVGGGYHGLFPISPEQAANLGAVLNEIHRELVEEEGFIPVCAGVSPVGTPGGAPIATGFDPAQVLVAMTDWDNEGGRAQRVKAIHDAFPNAWCFFERPGPAGPNGRVEPEAGPEDPIPPTPDNGGSWIRLMKQTYPRLVGVLYEVNHGNGLQDCQDELVRCHAWYRDLTENLFEIDTYEKFWYGLGYDDARVFNDELKARMPWFSGCMSGWTMQLPPPDEAPVDVVVGEGGADQINPAEIISVDQGDLFSWPVATAVTRLELRLTGMHADFDKRDEPGRWPDVVPPGWEGAINYSLGLVLKVNGQWYAAAPIEMWHDRDEGGGGIQLRAVEGTSIGQIPKNWFYDQRWGALAGYQPQPGELVGFYVAAGSVRNRAYRVRERSYIVTFPLPADGQVAVFEWK